MEAVASIWAGAMRGRGHQVETIDDRVEVILPDARQVHAEDLTALS